MDKFDQLEQEMAKVDPQRYEFHFDAAAKMFFDQAWTLIDDSKREQFEVMANRYLEVLARMTGGVREPAATGHPVLWKARGRAPSAELFARVQLRLDEYDKATHGSKNAYFKHLGSDFGCSRSWFNKWISKEKLNLK